MKAAKPLQKDKLTGVSFEIYCPQCHKTIAAGFGGGIEVDLTSLLSSYHTCPQCGGKHWKLLACVVEQQMPCLILG